MCGSGFPQPHALICTTPATRRRISDAAEKEALQASLLAHLAEANAKLEHHEVVQFCAVVKDDWTIDNGFLTPKMSLKRAVIEETYGAAASGWYASGDKVIWQS